MGLFDKFKKKDTSIKLVAPMDGEVIDVTEVADPVFAQKMVGDGVAIKPTSGTIVSPCDGVIKLLFPTGHAMGIEVDGVELLLHLGMDTVELKGEGFTTYIKQGDTVTAGQKIIDMDLDLIQEKGYLTVSPLIITNGDVVASMNKHLGQVEAGKDVVLTIEKK